MPSLRDIKRRINSVRSTQKITRAMKMVAAAKLRRSQEAIVRARPYAYHMRDMVDNVALRTAAGAHPLLNRPAQGKTVLVVVTGDRGLCGAFNSNIVNSALRTLRDELAGREVEVTAVGRKGIEVLRRRGVALRGTHTGMQDDKVLRAAYAIVDDLVAGFLKGDVAEIHCLYNEFRSAIAQRVTLEKLLPFEPASDGGVIAVDYLYEPSEPGVLEALLIQNLRTQMHRILLESAASEQGARMTAMESATKNAGDMIAQLTLRYNRARQEKITKEMIEIVSGAEAL